VQKNAEVPVKWPIVNVTDNSILAESAPSPYAKFSKDLIVILDSKGRR
jgi:hypothetical protein